MTEKAENEMTDAEMKEAPRNYDPVTLKDEKGRYPPWLVARQKKELYSKRGKKRIHKKRRK